MIGTMRAVLVGAFCLVAGPESKAGAAGSSNLAPQAGWAIVPVVVFGDKARLTSEEFARQNHLDAEDVRRRHAASGVVQCGNARGAGQLTLADNVITTAAHVFYDERGALRGDSAHCLFSARVGDEDVTTAIDVGSIVAGSADPYARPPVHDWAVARLMRPLRGATPYALGASAQARQDIQFVARGHSDWGSGSAMSLQACRLRDALDAGAEGTREFSFDCDAGLGASGGALLNPAGARLLAVFVGFRSLAPDRPMAFSPQHFNFAVTLEGAFRRAVETAAGGAATASAH